MNNDLENRLLNAVCVHLLDFKQAQSFVLGKDLTGLVAIQVNGKAIGIEPELFGYLREK